MPETAATGPRGRRLAPEQRRAQILDAARTLFAERPFVTVTTADVAQEAGVARSLVHHYFGGIREVFLAVVAEAGAALSDVRSAGPEMPLEQRLAHNVAAGLDVIAANRETWLAVAGHGAATADPQLRALADAVQQRFAERTLALNSDVLADTPRTRLLLACFNQFASEATRRWLTGRATRAEVEALLTRSFRSLLLDALPALERDEAGGR